ncbi:MULTISPECIES: efflux RND transporter periplasmic adaptor subunit [Sphingomonadaceae]|jgi:RND family efflux transporter MFP subunit|uniref:RND transporter n=7 Tax=Sphingomonadaceae TaxID=41297 RepID=A0A0S3F193_9SPHN|nr:MULTISPECIES: efflux RND transporter periplasmic adaptor subunit [Sphingomonadaceae]ARR56427.1 efflux transporter periplasmic adaptor subunit [Rhizorhabdus wittichii DC-6]ALR21414.1 RND transporter [Sphingobium baderi]AMK18113.1 RND family efflux transporter MFP subunit [Sphingobium sp. MI1205]KEQ55582.1 putative efflux pump periplasmic linker protein [Sphingobium chlorophenolicum]QUT05403.1 efflux RND transporter periplasmic adaptor subunit [Sphingobium phenoxybenzoativorans]
MMSGRGKWLWLAGAALALSACGSKPEQEQAAATLPAGETLRLAATEIPDMKVVGAEIATRDQAEVLARIPGILTSLSVRAGDTVQKGQRIGMIVDSRLGYETSAYGAQTAAAQAEAARTNADLARIRDLYGQGVYAKARLDQAVAAARAADAQVAAARAQQGASVSVAGQGAVIAPASGRVLRADIPAGSPVAPGMSIATVTAGPPVLRLMLPESVAGQVHPGARVIVNEADMPSGQREGSVAQVYPAITGGQVRVDATLPGLSTQFIGRRVSASVEIGTRKALVVPRSFITTRYGMDQVQIVAEGKRLSMVPVQIAPTADPALVEILSGAAAGDVLFAPGKPAKAPRP